MTETSSPRKLGASKSATSNKRQATGNSERPPPFIITIDGPGGVGKSTAAKQLARRLELTYLDTGATYRALALATLRAGLNPIADRQRVAALARTLPLELREDAAGVLRIFLDGNEVTSAIRTEEVTEAAAQVSQHEGVRNAMVSLQRSLADKRGVVVEGRDTGSVVFPHAAIKFFLDAEAQIRAKRRQRELARLYQKSSPLVQIQEQLHLRDQLDKTRRVGPLTCPRGAVVIDTSRLNQDQVLHVMLEHIRQTKKSLTCKTA